MSHQNHTPQKDKDILAAYAGAMIKIGTPGAVKTAMDIHDWINKRKDKTQQQ
jgi:hypothetical protein